jgi:hypothetical protein
MPGCILSSPDVELRAKIIAKCMRRVGFEIGFFGPRGDTLSSELAVCEAQLLFAEKNLELLSNLA